MQVVSVYIIVYFYCDKFEWSNVISLLVIFQAVQVIIVLIYCPFFFNNLDSVEKAASALCDINLIKTEQGVPILTKPSPLFL